MTFSELMRRIFGGYDAIVTSPYYRLQNNLPDWRVGDVHGSSDFVPVTSTLRNYGSAQVYAPVTGTIESISRISAPVQNDPDTLLDGWGWVGIKSSPDGTFHRVPPMHSLSYEIS